MTNPPKSYSIVCMSAEIRRNISPDSKEVADLFLKAKKIFDLQIRPGDRNPDAVEEMSRNNINNLVGGLKTCGFLFLETKILQLFG